MELLVGTSIIPTVGGRTDPVEDALHAESLGFDLVMCWDHLHGDHPSYETLTLLTWIAARTERIRIGTDVLGLPYRHPTVTAKMAETLDRLSGGRLVLGVGAGGNDDEFRSWGLEVRARREKVDALEEAIEVIRGMWAQGTFTYEGFHYRTEGALLEPKPERDIPIWLGTYGPRALEVTGRLADGWLPSMYYAPLDRARKMRERVMGAAEEAGRDPDEITYAYNIAVLVQEGAAGSEKLVAGGPDEVTERLIEIAEAGFNCLNLTPRGDRIGGRERLMKEIVPALRDAVG